MLWGDSNKYPQHMFPGLNKGKKCFLTFIIPVHAGILYSGKFFLTAESWGTNTVVITRILCMITHIYCILVCKSKAITLKFSYSDHPKLRPIRILFSYFWSLRDFFLHFLQYLNLQMRPQWNCTKMVFKTTFGQCQSVSKYRGFYCMCKYFAHTWSITCQHFLITLGKPHVTDSAMLLKIKVSPTWHGKRVI